MLIFVLVVFFPLPIMQPSVGRNSGFCARTHAQCRTHGFIASSGADTRADSLFLLLSHQIFFSLPCDSSSQSCLFKTTAMLRERHRSVCLLLTDVTLSLVCSNRALRAAPSHMLIRLYIRKHLSALQCSRGGNWITHPHAAPERLFVFPTVVYVLLLK